MKDKSSVKEVATSFFSPKEMVKAVKRNNENFLRQLRDIKGRYS